MSSKKKVFITRDIPEAGINLLLKENYSVEVYNKNYAISKKELIKKGKDADAIISLLTDIIDEEVISHFDKCKIIANFAVGYNNIDINFAKKKNIIVTNTPGVLTDSTAEITLALILACSRRIIEGDVLVRKNQFKGWAPKFHLGIELKGKTLGIIGFGRIGQAVANRAIPFGMKILYYSRSEKEEAKKLNAKKVSLDKLLKESDIISLHIPLTEKTNNLLNKQKLNLLKKDAILINTARGEIIDEEYLIKLLQQRKIHSAGLDVYQNEPKVNKEFLKLRNVVLLPHIGSATYETRSKMAILTAENVINVLSGKKPLTSVW